MLLLYKLLLWFCSLDLYLIPVLKVQIEMASFYEEKWWETFPFYCDSIFALWADGISLLEVVLLLVIGTGLVCAMLESLLLLQSSEQCC